MRGGKWGARRKVVLLLRQPPTPTPASSSIFRVSSQESAGSRSVARLDRPCLEVPKHRRRAERAVHHRLARQEGAPRMKLECHLFSIRSRLRFKLPTPFDRTSKLETARWKAEESRVRAWHTQNGGVFITKPECPLFSARSRSRFKPQSRLHKSRESTEESRKWNGRKLENGGWKRKVVGCK